MKKEYDFTKGKRGPVIPSRRGKTRITIRLDADVLEWFRQQVHAAGGGSYQTMINDALRQFVHRRPDTLESTIRRVLRQELTKRTRRTGTKAHRVA